MYNLFPWLTVINNVRIHDIMVGNDAYEITEQAIKTIREKKKDETFEVVETPEMDISDCSGAPEGAKAKVYLIKCHDRTWIALQKEYKKLGEEKGIPVSDTGLLN